MRTKFIFSAVLSLLFAFTSVSKAQTDSSEGAEEVKLVRVKPADIGPKKGKIDSDVDATDGEGAGKVDTKNSKSDGAALEIIFDCSNSMNARIGGVPKIDLAKDALYHLTQTLSSTNLKTGFRVFGHDRTIDREDRPKACVNSELIIPIEAGNTQKIRAKIPELVAWGRTPIAYSLEEAGKDLDPFLESSPMVLLISDGIESCDRDPLKAIQDLKARGVNVRMFVIGFDLNEEERLTLQQIAAVGNGQYYNAKNYGELLQSFDKFAKDVAIAAEPAKKKYTNPAQGGVSFEEATEVAPGRYTIWKDLEKGEWAYFKVPSKKGQRVAIKAHIQSNAVYQVGGELKEAKYAQGSAMVWFYQPDGKRISGRRVQLQGDVGEWQRQHTLDITGEGSFFAVGSDYNPTSRHVMFEVIVQEAGDLYEGWEATDSVKNEGIFEAPLNDPFYGHIGTEDKFDVYKLNLKAAGNPAKVTLDIKFSDVDDECAFLIETYGADKKRIARFTKLKSAATLELKTQGLDEIYLSIKDNNPGLYHLMNSYQLELKTK
ncbi:MAG: vWA domain-containing protein [Verrucomicrobiales bacterium]